MSDSFADLWNSSAPTKPTPPPQKLGAATPQSNNIRRPQHDVFSMLSSAGSSAPSSRPITPSMAGVTQPQKPQPKPTIRGSGDAFSSLLAGTLGASSSNGAHLTIAERAAKAERERRENLQKHQQAVKVQTSAWDGLDTLATPVSITATSPNQHLDDDDWGFGSVAPTSKTNTANKRKVKSTTPPSLPDEGDWNGIDLLGKPQSTNKPKANSTISPAEDDWGLGDFAVKPSAPKVNSSQPPPRSQTLWDLDDFTSPQAASDPPPSPPIPPRRFDSPGDFDFGDREDALLGDDSHDEDDILGVLSKPVDAIPKRTSPTNRGTPSPQPPLTGNNHANNSKSNGSSRPISPPPHIIGQIVEMGFSPQQARIALAATDTGLDVQSALETLLSNGAGSESPPRQEPPEPRQRRQRPPPSRTTSNSNSTSVTQNARERLTREQDTPSPSGSQQERNIQDQADKLLAQASEIGLSVFNRANAFWNTGKEKVQKAYEERARAAAAADVNTGAGGTGAGGGGRPRWMQEVTEDDDGWRDRDGESSAGFSDGPRPPKPTKAARPKPESQPPPRTQPSVKAPDLFSDEPTAYVSPFRRSRPKAPPIDPPKPAARAPSPIRPVQRQGVVSAPPAAIAASSKHKDLGGEKFKLGQYGEAEAAYTAAISALPASHLLLVPLYNNRALTRLKTGDHSGAVEDATTVITLIGPKYHPAREAKVGREDERGGVDLGDGLVKALKRRAEAWEGRERWEDARCDWEAVAAAEWAKGGLRGEAVRGAGRCRRMANVDLDSGAMAGSVAAKPPAKTRPPPVAPRPPARRGPTPPSQALDNLRKANNAAEAEDQERHELKDVVDARLVGWKGGKETNIRALIASLEAVLWPELGWQKVGMADLVTPAQVKVRYTKAIAKLHPDKLNTHNTTLEQRMIANGVFGALNEAWNAFKQ